MRRLYRMKCPICGHEYQYEGEWREWEYCPQPHENNGAPFDKFVIEVRDT